VSRIARDGLWLRPVAFFGPGCGREALIQCRVRRPGVSIAQQLVRSEFPTPVSMGQNFSKLLGTDVLRTRERLWATGERFCTRPTEEPRGRFRAARRRTILGESPSWIRTLGQPWALEERSCGPTRAGQDLDSFDNLSVFITVGQRKAAVRRQR
jgi:hypothetical protein